METHLRKNENLLKELKDLQIRYDQLNKEYISKSLNAEENALPFEAHGLNWKSITESSANHIFIIDKNYIIKFVNHTIPELSKVVLLEKSIFDFIEEDQKSKVLKAYEKVKAFKTTENYESFHLINENNSVYFDVQVSPLMNDNRDLIGFVSTSTDITHAKESEINIKEKTEEIEAQNEELRQANDELYETIKRAEISEERFYLAMKASTDGLFDWDLVNETIYYSPGWKKMLGYAERELPNDFSVWENLTLKEDIKASWEMQQKLISKEIDRFVFEFKMKHKKGHWVDILSRAKAVFNEEGEAIRVVGTHTNVSERKLMELKLKDSENYLSAVFNNTQDSQLLTRFDGGEKFTVVAVNNSYINKINQLGLKGRKEDLLGKSLKDLIFNILFLDQDLYEYTLNFYQKAIETQEQINISETFEIEQQTYHSESTYTPILNSEDGKQYIMYNSHDVTNEKQSKELLKKSEERFALAVNGSNDGIWDWYDIESDAYWWSDRLYEMLGYQPNEVEARISNWIKWMHPDDSENVLKALNLHFEKEIPYRVEFRMKKKNGDYIWLLARGETVRDENGKPIRMAGSLSDISESKASEIEILESKELAEINEERFKAYTQHSPIGIYSTDEKGNCIYANSIWLEFAGLSFEQAQGKGWIEALHPDDRDFINENWYKSVESNGKWAYEYRFKTPEGKIAFVEGSAKPLYNKDNILIGYLGSNVDITDRKKAELELIRAKENAEESDHLKSAFLANMSHEIRTPMNGILGFAELLKKPKLTGEKQEKYVNIIQKSGKRMLNIINDIVDISKIEAGLMKVELNPSNINDQMEYIHTFFKPEVELKGLGFSLKNSLALDDSVILTDREKLFAILTNLVKNAIKYTESGKIDFGYYLIGTGAEQKLKFFVKDTGIGIPEGRQKAIFERFIQADIVDKLARQGAGLGLSISKSFVEILGGEIWAESKEQKGSSFYFTIPYIKPNTQLNESKDSFENDEQIYPLDTKKINILIAEDDETSEELISIMLEDTCEKMIKAKNGLEVVQMCRENKDLDLILMDIRMPQLDGYSATQQIREFNKDVIIIAQTAYGLSGDKEKALEAGCNAYLSKPIDKTELYELIERYINL